MSWISTVPEHEGLYWVRNNHNKCIWPLELHYNQHKAEMEWYQIGDSNPLPYDSVGNCSFMKINCPEGSPYYFDTLLHGYVVDVIA